MHNSTGPDYGINKLAISTRRKLMKKLIPILALTFFGTALSGLANASPDLPPCQTEVDNQRALYMLGISIGAGIEANDAQTGRSQISDGQICEQIGSTRTAFQSYLATLKAFNVKPSVPEATRLIQLQAHTDNLGSFCSPQSSAGALNPVGQGDRQALQNAAQAEADLAVSVLTQDIGCKPSHQ
jgi:hypothetical protein